MYSSEIVMVHSPLQLPAVTQTDAPGRHQELARNSQRDNVRLVLFSSAPARIKWTPSEISAVRDLFYDTITRNSSTPNKADINAQSRNHSCLRSRSWLQIKWKIKDERKKFQRIIHVHNA